MPFNPLCWVTSPHQDEEKERDLLAERIEEGKKLYAEELKKRKLPSPAEIAKAYALLDEKKKKARREFEALRARGIGPPGAFSAPSSRTDLTQPAVESTTPPSYPPRSNKLPPAKSTTLPSSPQRPNNLQAIESMSPAVSDPRPQKRKRKPEVAQLRHQISILEGKLRKRRRLLKEAIEEEKEGQDDQVDDDEENVPPVPSIPPQYKSAAIIGDPQKKEFEWDDEIF